MEGATYIGSNEGTTLEMEGTTPASACQCMPRFLSEKQTTSRLQLLLCSDLSTHSCQLIIPLPKEKMPR